MTLLHCPRGDCASLVPPGDESLGYHDAVAHLALWWTEQPAMQRTPPNSTIRDLVSPLPKLHLAPDLSFGGNWTEGWFSASSLCTSVVFLYERPPHKRVSCRSNAHRASKSTLGIYLCTACVSGRCCQEEFWRSPLTFTKRPLQWNQFSSKLLSVVFEPCSFWRCLRSR